MWISKREWNEMERRLGEMERRVAEKAYHADVYLSYYEEAPKAPAKAVSPLGKAYFIQPMPYRCEVPITRVVELILAHLGLKLQRLPSRREEFKLVEAGDDQSS